MVDDVIRRLPRVLAVLSSRAGVLIHFEEFLDFHVTNSHV